MECELNSNQDVSKTREQGVGVSLLERGGCPLGEIYGSRLLHSLSPPHPHTQVLVQLLTLRPKLGRDPQNKDP